MPIILDNNSVNISQNLKTASETKYTPKYFDTRLTGTGESGRGILNRIANAPIDLMGRTLSNFNYHYGDKSAFPLMDYGQRMLENISNQKNLFAPTHHSVRKHAGQMGTFIDSFQPLTLFTHVFERNLHLTPAKIELPIDFKPLAIDKLTTDIAKLRIEEALLQNGTQIDEEDLYKSSWEKLNIGVSDVEMYVEPMVELYTRVAHTAPPTKADQSPKTTYRFSFSGHLKIAFVSDKATNAATTHKVENLFINDLNTQNEDLVKDAVANVLGNKSIVIIRIPLLSMLDNQVNAVTGLLSNLLKEFPTMDSAARDNIFNALTDACANANLFETLSKQAENMDFSVTNHLLQTLDVLMANKQLLLNNKVDLYELISDTLQIAMTFESFNEENITTIDFNKIYNRVETISALLNFTKQQLNQLTASHLRLMLASNLYKLSLAADNGKLYKFKAKNDAVKNKYRNKGDLSFAQKSVVLAENPLITVSAGAGSGKSHTVVNRLSYLYEQGEDLSKVLVLSFTNVAAKNIITRFPAVQSLTLGDLFNRIYQQTFPIQRLSQVKTFRNALELVNVENKMFSQFKPEHLTYVKETFIELMDQINPVGYRKINLSVITAQVARFMSENFDECISLMNAVGQTTLDLQAIVIHTLMTNQPQKLNIPAEFSDLKFIITDESQDISTFEYVLLLSMAEKQGANLAIVGDGSQTLFEFRNSNPRFLNAIEASGVFTPFRLVTNYRSKQPILMYANQFLQVIEANKYAQIQLSSSKFEKVDQINFSEAVKVTNLERTREQAEYFDDLSSTIHSKDIAQWLETRLKNNEQVAIMAFRHKELNVAIEAVNDLVQNRLGLKMEVEKITPTKQKPKCDLSDVIGKHREDLYAIAVDVNFESNYREFFKNCVLKRFKKAKNQFVPFYVLKALDALFAHDFIRALYQDALNQVIKPIELHSRISQFLIDYEIRLNNTINLINANDKTEKDISHIPLVASTIHSAKGLEFDHCLVIYDETMKEAKSQELLRLFGVALTRAKKSELIINAVLDPSCLAKSGQQRIVTDQLNGMFQTPMETAYMRTLNDIANIQNNKPVITAFNQHVHDELNNDETLDLAIS